MKKQIINISIFLMCSALCFASIPKWLTDLEKAFPASDYVRAVGEGESESAAKKSALSELSSYFNQTISSQTQALKHIERDNSSYIEKGDVRQNLITSTKSDLVSVQYTNSVYDKRNEKYYVCAYLIRKDVWNVISQKMDVLMNGFKSSLSLLNEETETLNQLIQLNRTEQLFSDFYLLYEMALATYPHRCSEFTAFAEKNVSELSALSSIRSQATIKVIVNGDRQNRIKGKICSLLSQNGITVAEQNSRYVLIADVLWNESQFNGIYSSTPQIQITVSNKNTGLAFYAAKCEKLSAYNHETIEQLAVANLEDQLEERFITECFQKAEESMNKRIIILTMSFLLSGLLFANTTIDGAITKAAVDITEKCDAKSILAIDDFESPSQAMTLYIREQLADSIFAEDGLLQIVTREHMDKVEKELKFQNSGVASEKTILSVAERLGARFIVFGKLEEFNSSYILRVRMLDVKTGAYLFRRTYEFQYSQKTEQLLGRAPNYKKVSLGLLVEANKNSLDFIAPSIGFAFDYSPWRKISIGAKAAASYDMYEKNNDLLTLEALGTLRFYIVSLTGEPVTGIYTELQAGTSLFFVNSNIKPAFNGGASIGYRFALNNFYIEPEIRFGYPYLFGCGIYVGMRF